MNNSVLKIEGEEGARLSIPICPHKAVLSCFLRSPMLICTTQSMSDYCLLPKYSSERSPCLHLQEMTPRSTRDYRTATCSHSGGRSHSSRNVSTIKAPGQMTKYQDPMGGRALPMGRRSEGYSERRYSGAHNVGDR